jgi:hypothetical protein
MRRGDEKGGPLHKANPLISIQHSFLSVANDRKLCYILAMKKSVIDLSPEELDKFASDAWKTAANEALASGHSITGSRDGRRFRYHPDGRVEDLGPIFPAFE